MYSPFSYSKLSIILFVFGLQVDGYCGSCTLISTKLLWLLKSLRIWPVYDLYAAVLSLLCIRDGVKFGEIVWPSFIVLKTLETGYKLVLSVLCRFSGAKWNDLDPGRRGPVRGIPVRFVFIRRLIFANSRLLSIWPLSKPGLLTPICGDSVTCLLRVGVNGLLIFS